MLNMHLLDGYVFMLAWWERIRFQGKIQKEGQEDAERAPAECKQREDLCRVDGPNVLSDDQGNVARAGRGEML